MKKYIWGAIREVEKRTCKKCSIEFYTDVYQIKRGYGIFCSNICKLSYMASCGNSLRTGSKNPRWKGGISKKAVIYKRKSIKKYPERNQARKITEQAIRSGALIRKPCEVCSELKSEAHHEDYKKPLEIRWLCRKHHVRADALRRAKEKAELS